MSRRLAVLLIAVFGWSCLHVAPGALEPDERHNIIAGYNIATHGVMSVQMPDGEPPAADMRREPLYPFLLSLVLRPGEPDLQCVLAGSDGCTERLVAVKSINVLMLVVVAGLSYAVARLFVPEPWALACAAAAGFSPALAFYSNRLLTEPAAAALLLTGTYCLVRMHRAHAGTASWAAASGIVFGVLILVKSLFLFVVPAVAAVMVIGRGPRLIAARRSALIVGLAVLVLAPWSVRNAVQLGSPMPTSGATNVLAVRAESMSMTRREYVSSFVYYSGPAGPRIAVTLFGERDVRRHDREHPSGFFLQAITEDGMAADENPHAVIRRQPLKYLALTLPFAWQGAFGTAPMGMTSMTWWWEPLRQLYLGLTAAGVLLRWAGFLAFFYVIGRAWRDTSLRPLIAPVGLLFAAYALTSHFIPRYGQPLMPVTYVCLAITGHQIWQRRAFRRLAGAPRTRRHSELSPTSGSIGAGDVQRVRQAR